MSKKRGGQQGKGSSPSQNGQARGTSNPFPLQVLKAAPHGSLQQDAGQPRVSLAKVLFRMVSFQLFCSSHVTNNP
jgi:hypothetical protein